MDNLQSKSSRGLTSFTLKLIAILSMMIDHTGAVLYPQHVWMRMVGRLAFPIFCFLLVEGILHTRNVKKYGIRLGIFAFLSEIPFDLAFYGKAVFNGHQNVFFTLLIGLVVVAILEKNKKKEAMQEKKYRYYLVDGLTVFLGMAAADILKTDYGSFGLLLILCFYVFRGSKIRKSLAAGIVNLFTMEMQALAALSLVPIWFYNGRKGPSMKYVFYGFYPLHLLILYIIHRT